jgi:hypothetical protein
MNWRGDEILHECVIRNDKRKSDENRVAVSIDLYRRNFIKRFGRSRKKIFWVIYIETKAGRSFLSYALQKWIPLQAFKHFEECIVEDDSERIFLDHTTYEERAAHDLRTSCPPECLALIGLA